MRKAKGFFSNCALVLEFGGAVSATSGVQSDLAFAEGADLGGGSGCFLFFAHRDQRVDSFDQEEKDEGGEDEVDYGGKEIGKATADESEGKASPTPSEDDGQKGTDETFGQSRNDGGKGTADDDADGHVQYVSAQGEFFKFVQKVFHVGDPFVC